MIPVAAAQSLGLKALPGRPAQPGPRVLRVQPVRLARLEQPVQLEARALPEARPVQLG